MPCHTQNRLAQLIHSSFPVISDGGRGTGAQDDGGRLEDGSVPTTGGRALPCIVVIREAALAADLIRNY